MWGMVGPWQRRWAGFIGARPLRLAGGGALTASGVRARQGGRQGGRAARRRRRAVTVRRSGGRTGGGRCKDGHAGQEGGGVRQRHRGESREAAAAGGRRAIPPGRLPAGTPGLPAAPYAAQRRGLRRGEAAGNEWAAGGAGAAPPSPGALSSGLAAASPPVSAHGGSWSSARSVEAGSGRDRIADRREGWRCVPCAPPKIMIDICVYLFIFLSV